MIDAMLLVILVSAGLLVLSVITSVVALRVGAPLLLLFLGIGLLAGEDGIGGIPFDGSEEAFFIGSVAIAIILFTSGFETRWSAFRQAAAPALVLATAGVILTAGLVGVAARLLLGLDWLEALLLGAIVGSTDAAAVFFLLRVGGITIRDRVRSTLEVESGSNDPMAIFLVVVLLELVVADAGVATVGLSLLQAFALQMGLGLVLGLAGGWVVVQVINRTALEPGLYPVAVMGGIAILFAGTGLLGGSGFLAVYVAGLVVGNLPVRATPYLHRFQEGFTWLAQIVLFLTLGLLATPSAFADIFVPVLAVALVLIVLARPLAVGLCLWPFGFRRNEVVFMSFVGLRGAVSILFAILPITAGLANGQLLFNAAFIIVLVSLLVQGWTIAPFARWLEVVVPPRTAPVERVELELPGTAHHELVVYHITDGSPVAKGHRLPRWARPALVVRDGRSYSVHLAGRLKPDDYVYIFTGPAFIPLLDRLFASRASLDAADRAFYGDLPITPGASIAALARSYGIDVAASSEDETVAAFLARQFDGRLELADRLALGPVDLIVRAVDEAGDATEIGLSLARVDEAVLSPPGFWRRQLGRVRRLLGGSPKTVAVRAALGVGGKRQDDG